MALNINIFEKQKSSTSATPFTYSDVEQDMKFGQIFDNFPGSQTKNNSDISLLYDIEAIKNSIVNCFNTVPGQKLLNPRFGINLLKYVFAPVNEDIGKQISETIILGLAQQEPRVKVVNLKVIGNPDEQTYEVYFGLIFPNLNNKQVQFNGVLSQQGFKV